MNERVESGSEPARQEATAGRERAAALEALEGLERGNRDALENLRLALCRYVSALRRQKVSPENALIQVRELIARPATIEGVTKMPPIAREALVELALSWCSEEFAKESADDEV